MKPFSCAIAAQRAEEDLISTAGHYQAYVLIECPMPWAAIAFHSDCIPQSLGQYIQATKTQKSVQFLCINRGVSTPPKHITLIVYERTDICTASPNAGQQISRFTGGYRGYEFHLADLKQVVPCLDAYWNGQFPHTYFYQHLGPNIPQQDTHQQHTHQQRLQDILVCTHGMRDKCCARLGQPFFREAKRMAKQGNLPHTRVWQVSHIGGHRFAPTIISLPDGRYYGRLSLSTLQAIIMRHGSIHQLRSAYRGWGILPSPLQVLERRLLFSHGWSWFNHTITYRPTTANNNHHPIQAEISVRQASGTITMYRAQLIPDPKKTCYFKASCGDTSPSLLVKYTVLECSTQPSLSTQRTEREYMPTTTISAQ